MEPQANEPKQNFEPVNTPGVESSPKPEEVISETAAPTAAAASENTEAPKPADDMSEYQTYAILGYVIPFLFFLPLLDEKTKNVPYVRFHANQQLILLVVIFGVYILHSFLFSMLMMLGYYVAQVMNLAIIALAIIGIFNAYNGKMKELPFVGQFKLLK